MTGLVEYPLALKGADRWARLRLPSDFNERDLARVIAYLRTLALASPPDEPPPPREVA